MTAPRDVQIVTAPQALAAVCERLRQAGRFAFDTEFVAEENYKPQVCLIQAATDSFCALIDPLSGLSIRPFWELVADESIEIVVHAGAEDVAICREAIGRPAAGVVDTQIAAGLAGLGYPISLTRLVRQTTGARMHKSQTLTDWRRRPMTDDQIEYAVEDVAHLPAVWAALESKLRKAGRRLWLDAECAEMCRSAGEAAGRTRLRRVSGTASLSRRELAVVDALLAEREKLAAQYDRPARAVLRDHLLVEMARRGWTDAKRLRSLRGVNLSDAALRRLSTVIRAAQQLPDAELPQSVDNGEDTAEEDVLCALVTAVLRNHCNEQDIAAGLLANRRHIQAVVRRYTRNETIPPGGLGDGWRRDAVGDLLDRVLTGKAVVRVHGQGRRRRLAVDG